MKNTLKLFSALMLVLGLFSTAHAASIDSSNAFALSQTTTDAPAEGEEPKKPAEEEEPDC
ncbi:MAG: hypothetical protein V3V09_00055 [Arenicellales bacterium]